MERELCLSQQYLGFGRSNGDADRACETTVGFWQRLGDYNERDWLGHNDSRNNGRCKLVCDCFDQSLGSGDLQGALSALTSFLVSTGQASGNLVNTTA